MIVKVYISQSHKKHFSIKIYAIVYVKIKLYIRFIPNCKID